MLNFSLFLRRSRCLLSLLHLPFLFALVRAMCHPIPVSHSLITLQFYSAEATASASATRKQLLRDNGGQLSSSTTAFSELDLSRVTAPIQFSSTACDRFSTSNEQTGTSYKHKKNKNEDISGELLRSTLFPPFLLLLKTFFVSPVHVRASDVFKHESITSLSVSVSLSLSLSLLLSQILARCTERLLQPQHHVLCRCC